MPINEANRVIIRVWTSGKNNAIPGEDVGHISLSFGSTYVSFWPAKGWQLRKQGYAPGLYQPVEGQYKVDYEADCQAEARLPEMTVCLYSLDIESMQAAFEKIQAKTEGWAVLGNNFILNRNTAHSCSSLAYELLKAGNIYDLIPGKLSSTLSSAPSPDMLLNAVIKAKHQELEKHLETTAFIYLDESPLPDGNTKSGLCAVM